MDFLILCYARTGSNILNRFLHRQKDSQSLGELLNKKKQLSRIYLWERKDEFVTDTYTEINKIYGSYTKENWADFRYNNPELFLNWVRKYKSKNLIGFKFLFDHLLATKSNFNFIEFCLKNKTRIVILNRENKFLHYLSCQKVKESGVYMILKNNPQRKDDIKVTVNIEKYINWKNYNKHLYKTWENNFAYHNIPFIQTSYENIVGNNAFLEKSRAYKFVTNSDNVPEDKILINIKQNIYTLEHQIENFEEVSSELKDDPHFIAALDQDIKKTKRFC